MSLLQMARVLDRVYHRWNDTHTDDDQKKCRQAIEAKREAARERQNGRQSVRESSAEGPGNSEYQQDKGCNKCENVRNLTGTLQMRPKTCGSSPCGEKSQRC